MVHFHYCMSMKSPYSAYPIVKPESYPITRRAGCHTAAVKSVVSSRTHGFSNRISLSVVPLPFALYHHDYRALSRYLSCPPLLLQHRIRKGIYVQRQMRSIHLTVGKLPSYTRSYASSLDYEGKWRAWKRPWSQYSRVFQLAIWSDRSWGA